MNEDSRGHGRHYTKGGILFTSPKTSYMEANTQKDEEICVYAMEIILGHPEHGLGAASMQNSTVMHPEDEPGTPSIHKLH